MHSRAPQDPKLMRGRAWRTQYHSTAVPLLLLLLPRTRTRTRTRNGTISAPYVRPPWKHQRRKGCCTGEWRGGGWRLGPDSGSPAACFHPAEPGFLNPWGEVDLENVETPNRACRQNAHHIVARKVLLTACFRIGLAAQYSSNAHVVCCRRAGHYQTDTLGGRMTDGMGLWLPFRRCSKREVHERGPVDPALAIRRRLVCVAG
jgi:hypothetical protein